MLAACIRHSRGRVVANFIPGARARETPFTAWAQRAEVMGGPANQPQGFQLTADASGRRKSASGKGSSARQPVAELSALPGASKLTRKDTPTLQV